MWSGQQHAHLAFLLRHKHVDEREQALRRLRNERVDVGKRLVEMALNIIRAGLHDRILRHEAVRFGGGGKPNPRSAWCIPRASARIGSGAVLVTNSPRIARFPRPNPA